MAKEEDQAIEVTGVVTKVLPATMYKVQLENVGTAPTGGGSLKKQR